MKSAPMLSRAASSADRKIWIPVSATGNMGQMATVPTGRRRALLTSGARTPLRSRQVHLVQRQAALGAAGAMAAIVLDRPARLRSSE